MSPFFIIGALVVLSAHLQSQTASPRIALNGASPEVSPDGTRVLFVSDRGGQGQIYIMNADGSNVRQLTSAASGALSPAWSADGKRFAFVRRDASAAHIYIMNADGTGLTLVENSENGWSPQWSPDGRKLAFTTVGSPARTVFTMNLDGSAKTLISPEQAFDLSPSWSPDGRQIGVTAFTRGATPATRGEHIVLMNADGTNRRELDLQLGTDIQAGPVWAPDGRAFAVTGVVRGDRGAPTDSFIHLVDAATGAQRRLGTHSVPSFDEAPSWFPDGKRLAIQSRRDGAWNIFIIDLTGTVVAQLTR